MSISTPPEHSLGVHRSAVLLIGVFLLSAAMLGFQILLVTVLQLQLMPEAGFLVVSLSMLGLGAGGSIVALVARRRDPASAASLLWWLSFTFVVALVLSPAMTSRLHALLPLILVCTGPFVLAGMFLSLAFARAPDDAGRVYFADLVGAAVGCVSSVVLLDVTGDAGLSALGLAALAACAAMAIGCATHPRHVVAAGLLLAVLLVLVPYRASLFVFGPAPQKFYGKLLASGADGGHRERERWNNLGRLDVVAPGPAIEQIPFMRGVKDLIADGASFRLLFSNGYNWSYTIDFRGDVALRNRYLSRWTLHAPYAFTRAPDVLNLGAGGGADMFIASLHGARSITGVDLNPLMIEATRGWYPDYWEGLWHRPEVSLLELDARTYVNTTAERYDVITLSAVDTGSTQTSLLSTNFLYTTEAFGAYLRILRPGGVVFLVRPREQLLRALTAAVSAMRGRGVPHPEQHVAVFGRDELLSGLVYADPLEPQRVSDLVARTAQGDFGGNSEYLPGLVPATPNLFSEYFAAVAAGHEARYLAESPRLIAPTTDDRPYFYNLERRFLGSAAGQLLGTILLWVIGIAAILIFAPLFGAPIPHKGRVAFGSLVYFGCLGIGFMLAEIGFLTKLALVLGNPMRSLTVTLGSMLLFAGFGSMVAGRMDAQRVVRGTTLALVAVPVLLAVATFAIELTATASLPRSTAIRILFVILVLAPVSFVMGMPFPMKLRSLAGTVDSLVPWAWATNGFASVAGSVLAVAIAMNFGFRSVFLTAGACYAMALVAHAVTRSMDTESRSRRPSSVS